jgi:hypothetical protein
LSAAAHEKSRWPAFGERVFDLLRDAVAAQLDLPWTIG